MGFSACAMERRSTLNAAPCPAPGPKRQATEPRAKGGRPMFSHFFIDRPIFATVLSVVIVIVGTVAMPIEQEVNGVENMIYMSSRCTNDGQMLLDVTFKLGTNLDMAQVLTQNRVKIAEAKLPEDVKRQGVTTKKKSPSILLCVNLISPDKSRNQLFLSNYATIQV